MTKKSILFILPSLLVLMACEQNKQLSEMHDTTQHMDKTTDTMNERMSELDKKTGTMKETTNELYDALRQGNGLLAREATWAAVLAAPSMFGKLAEAGLYYMGYELQLWNYGASDITVEKRDILAQQATQEFFLKIEELAPRDNSVDIFALPDPKDENYLGNNRAASFNAFAMMAHQVNRKQVANLKMVKNMEKMSIESMLEEALLSKEALEKGTAVLGTRAPYIREVLAHEDKAIQILQARYAFGTLAFLDYVVKINDERSLKMDLLTLTGQFLNWSPFKYCENLKGNNKVGKLLRMYFCSWDLDLDQAGMVRLEYAQNELLSQAVQAKAFLKKIHVEPIMDAKLVKILKNMTIKVGTKSDGPKAALQTHIVEMLHDVQPSN